jgi:broad specificity phosphatase PhoE
MKRVFKLLLVRHGETSWIREGKIQGRSDVSLNRAGRQQAGKAARFLRRYRPIRVFSSGLARSKQTAEIIRRQCKVCVTVDPRLNELFFGLWEGKTAKEISVRYPMQYKKWKHPRRDFRPPHGESIDEMKLRVGSFLNELKASGISGNLVVVSHGGPIRLMLHKLLVRRLGSFGLLNQSPCGVNIIEVVNGRSRAVAINYTRHLSR